VIPIDELFEGDVGDGEGVSEEWVWAHEADARQEVNVGPMVMNRAIKHEELFVPYHLRVDHVAEG